MAKITVTEKVFTAIGSINFLTFLYLLIFGGHGGWFYVDIPNILGEWILFYCPIIFTICCFGGFLIEYFLRKNKNWYWFFILTLSYLPFVLFILTSFHRTPH